MIKLQLNLVKNLRSAILHGCQLKCRHTGHIHGQYQILTATALWKLRPKFDVFVLQQDSACAIRKVMCSELGLQNSRGV